MLHNITSETSPINAGSWTWAPYIILDASNKRNRNQLTDSPNDLQLMNPHCKEPLIVKSVLLHLLALHKSVYNNPLNICGKVLIYHSEDDQKQ